MNLDSATVDRIVQEVVKRLAAVDPSAASIAAPREKIAGGTPATGIAAGETLRLSERTISWKAIEDRLAGVKTVEVSSNAVVTPLVRDLLRERRIRLEVVKANGRPAKGASVGSGTPALWVGSDRETVEARPHHVRALVRDVEREFLAEKALLDQTFPALTQLFAAKPPGRTLRLWFTDRLAEAVCQANRNSHVRATWANDPEEAARNVAALRPNVLILPPARFSGWQVRQVVAAWIASPVLA